MLRHFRSDFDTSSFKLDKGNRGVAGYGSDEEPVEARPRVVVHAQSVAVNGFDNGVRLLECSPCASAH